MNVFTLQQIQAHTKSYEDIEQMMCLQENVFREFSANLFDVPKPMQFLFPEFKSDCHIKGGYRKNSSYFFVKIASSSPKSAQGMILVFSAQTGKLIASLNDESYLTTLRTAMAAMIVSKITPWEIQKIGIIGSGNLAAEICHLAKLQYPNQKISIFARNREKALKISSSVYGSVHELIRECDVIFTATTSCEPIIESIPVERKKLIVALGSDDEYKSELAPCLYKQADFIVTDSKSQASKYGDIARALKEQSIKLRDVMELGQVLDLTLPAYTKTIIADLSGIGAQDVAITEYVLNKIGSITEISDSSVAMKIE